MSLTVASVATANDAVLAFYDRQTEENQIQTKGATIGFYNYALEHCGGRAGIALDEYQAKVVRALSKETEGWQGELPKGKEKEGYFRIGYHRGINAAETQLNKDGARQFCSDAATGASAIAGFFRPILFLTLNK